MLLSKILWYLSVGLVKLRYFLAKYYNLPQNTGQFIVAVKVDEVDKDTGKAPTLIHFFSDKTIPYEIIQQIGTEIAGTALALKRIKQDKDADKKKKAK